ncbi:MAG: RIO1 family regulatory kinase/ATPase [Candidatus Micrarchaeota archaeon]
MAMKMSTRKRPERSDKMLKEHQLKFSERAFDDITIRTLKELMYKGVFSSLDFPIQHGKEAAVYRATKRKEDGLEFMAVKIFKFEGPSFQRRTQYLEGDKRFSVPKSKRGLVKIFAKKEYANLKLCKEAGVRVPKPLKHKENVVVMEFLGEDGVPGELLKDAEIGNPKETLGLILEDMRKMHRAKLVHVDLSEFNIIWLADMPWIIDVGQAVLTHHPDADMFLNNDVFNILKYFAKLGVDVEGEKALKYIKGETTGYL